MEAATKRKVSPRAPTVSLEEAIARVAKMYRAEHRHAAPIDVALKHIGYNSKNGAALQAIASLGYWGLVDRTRDGALMVSKAFEDYQYTPDELHKRDLLIGFLKKPPVFAGMLEKYQDRLPSDATVKYDLIQLGFNPSTATTCLGVFKTSVQFAGYFERQVSAKVEEDAAGAGDDEVEVQAPVNFAPQPAAVGSNVQAVVEPNVPRTASADVDRILVRLAPGRTAWLEIPVPFYSADKKRLKSQIDLLLTFDEDGADA